MSVQTLYTAATGMQSMESKLEVIANNLANVNTTGFKKDRANFENLFYRDEVLPGAKDGSGNPTAIGISYGLGSRISGVQSDQRQGGFNHTKRELDVAIAGSGFFQVTDPNGETLYTRAGNFNVNANGQLVAGSASVGRVVTPAISIPNTAVGVTISPDGQVYYKEQGSATLTQAGQLQLAHFINPEGLLKLGENMFSETDASGSPIVGNPNQNGLGALRQNFLEASNVEPVQELIDLIQTQRSFELNSQMVQAGDQILQLVANLRRY